MNWGMTKLEKNNLTMIDLFSGAGIGALGFKLAGYDIIYAIDNQQFAVDTYNKNIGNHAVCGDIKKLNPKDVPYADIVVAGFPCQPFSFSGDGEGVNNKQKGDLGRYFYEFVKKKQPKAFFMENVGGLVSKKHKDFFWELVNNFEKAGYVLTFATKENGDLTTINCWDYGVPQLRKRVFVIGIRKDLKKKFEFPDILPESKRPNIRKAIGDLPEPPGKNNHIGFGIRNDEALFVDKIPPGGNWRDLPVEDQKIFLGGAFNSGGGRTGFLRKVDFDKPAYTITSMMDGKNNAQIVDVANKYKNHSEHYEGGYSPHFKSRNRQKQWDEPSFTIVSSERHIPLHPEPINYDIRGMDRDERTPPRRFTVRECLRLQTVPDTFSFDENIPLRKQYERCSGIPSLIAYKFGKELATLLNK